MNTVDAILTRRSVRSFTGEKIDRKDMDEILLCGMAGPSACNRRPWHFFLIEEGEEKEKIASAMPFVRPILTASDVVLVLGDESAFIRKAPLFWTEDASAAVENMLLAATDRGIGSLWMGVWPEEKWVGHIKGVLSIPDGYVPFALVAFGYAADEGESRWHSVGFEEERIHRGRW